MRYDLHLEFMYDGYDIPAENEKMAYIHCLQKIINEPKIVCESLFQKMIDNMGNNCYIERRYINE